MCYRYLQNEPRRVHAVARAFLLVAMSVPALALAGPPTITTVAGGYTGDGGQAVNAFLNQPPDVAVDAAGNLYVADCYNNRIRKMTPAGVITTIAGTGESSDAPEGDGAPATQARLHCPYSVAVDAAGNVYFNHYVAYDYGNYLIRKIAADGTLSTLAPTGHFSGGIAVDGDGNVFAADGSGERVVKIDGSGVVTTVAGIGTYGYSGDGGPATSAELGYPEDVAVDAAGNLYIADYGNHRVREVVKATGIITTIAGSGVHGEATPAAAATASAMGDLFGIAVDATGSSVYMSDRAFGHVYRIDMASGILDLVAGRSNGGYAYDGGFDGDGGAAADALLNEPQGVAVDAYGNVFVADAYNYRIRRVAAADSAIDTVAGNGDFGGDGGQATRAELGQLRGSGAVVDAKGNLYFTELANNRVRRVSATGVIDTVAGNGACGHAGDGGPATLAALCHPSDVAVDGNGVLYIADSGYGYVRKVDASGTITTVAGNGTLGYSGDGGPATSADMDPLSVAVDAAGRLYIGDGASFAVREVDASGNIHTVAGTPSTGGYDGDGGAATAAAIGTPTDLAFDAAGDLYIADPDHCVVRKVDTSGIITTVAGEYDSATDCTGGGYFSDGDDATSVKFTHVDGIAVDHSGNLFVADNWAVWVTEVTPDGKIHGFAGTSTNDGDTGCCGYAGDGGPATDATFVDTDGLAVDPGGDVYITDGLNHNIRKVQVDEIFKNGYD